MKVCLQTPEAESDNPKDSETAISEGEPCRSLDVHNAAAFEMLPLAKRGPKTKVKEFGV